MADTLEYAFPLASRHDFRHGYRLRHASTIGVVALGAPGAVALGAASA